ncbi:MAG: hypothetical protein ACI9YR_002372 [Bacteroidia bacterium]
MTATSNAGGQLNDLCIVIKRSSVVQNYSIFQRVVSPSRPTFNAVVLVRRPMLKDLQRLVMSDFAAIAAVGIGCAGLPTWRDSASCGNALARKNQSALTRKTIQ